MAKSNQKGTKQDQNRTKIGPKEDLKATSAEGLVSVAGKPKKTTNGRNPKRANKGAFASTKSGHKLTPQQELFCQLYASDREFFGNGVQSYIEAYCVSTSKPGWYATAKAGACENLTKPYILERINEIFEAHGLNDQFVDKQLEKLIVQDADFKVKMSAISEYNKLKARITQKIEQTSVVSQSNPFENLTEEELRKLAAEIK